MAIAILLIITILAIVVGILVFRLLTKSKIIISLLTIVFTIVVLILALIYIVPNYNNLSYEETLNNKYPFFKVIKEKSPADYNGFMAKVGNDWSTNPNKVSDDTALFLNDELNKYAQNASAKTLCAYANARLEAYRKLLTIDPTYILILEFPDQFQGKFDTATIDKAIKDSGVGESIINAKGAVIESALENPEPPLTNAQNQKVEAGFTSIGDSLVNKYGSDLVLATLKHPEDPSLDKSKAAPVIISFYESITSQDENDCGLMMKYNVSGPAK